MKTALINLGPQHPASHGVSRIMMEIDGEYIKNLDSQIGYLHRGTEKLAEYREFEKILPYFDRLDYVSTLSMEESYSLAVENLMNIEMGINTNTQRMILVELGRISNHLLALTTNAMDIGAITPFLWAFEIREKICVILEKICGARMHVAIIRPGGINNIITDEVKENIAELMGQLKKYLGEIHRLLYNNKIWRNRLQGTGSISYNQGISNSLSGILIRNSGINRDLRKTVPYGFYPQTEFSTPTTVNGDCFDRFHLRIEELYESMNIINFNLSKVEMLAENKFNIKYMDDMESVIKHFKIKSEGLQVEWNRLYHPVETPKGEFGVLLVNYHKYNRMSRIKCRAPGYIHLQSLSEIGSNCIITDMLAILASFNIVLGEIDR